MMSSEMYFRETFSEQEHQNHGLKPQSHVHQRTKARCASRPTSEGTLLHTREAAVAGPEHDVEAPCHSCGLHSPRLAGQALKSKEVFLKSNPPRGGRSWPHQES